MDQGCFGHIFLEANSHSVPKNKHRTFENFFKIKNLTKNVSQVFHHIFTPRLTIINYYKQQQTSKPVQNIELM